MSPRRILGVEKHYDWGDEVTIRHSLGLPSTPGTPVAELWCGTHPQGPSHVDSVRGPLLRDVTGDMSMMVKLLSCNAPLSLQTHPTQQQATDGFAREEALGIPRDASHRMYRDASDKPEMLVALSPFEALCGFTSVDQAVEMLDELHWNTEADFLKNNDIASYLAWAFTQDESPSLDHAPEWLRKISQHHPHDRALRVAPLMNHVVLQPGQALSLPAGNLHAYLNGFGLEVMSSSDNVIRAGFTTKHIDVSELLRVVDTTPLATPTAQRDPHKDGFYFASPSPSFSVGRFTDTSADADCHRIVYGINRSDVHAETEFPFRDMYLLPAGFTDPVNFEDAWVCVQH